ncbi:tubby-like F-box protein 14 [Musa acuminata AAA Group]|uniref:tubby-like F-box protein 14 n=1 Tax=Musa acuminata AAA Group TaxID=214697 RepID=UPI0031D0BC80
MSFCNIFCNARYSYGGSSRHDFETRLAGHCTPNSQVAVHEMHDQHLVVQASCWDSFPPELLNDVITRLDSESTWPFCKNVVACAGVCRSWREICKEIVKNPEFSGKFTFPVSLKQTGPRDSTIQCFVKRDNRDKSSLTYHLYLCLSSDVLVENGKFLLSAKKIRRATCTEYIISMDRDNITRSSNTYIGKVRSNFIETKFEIYDTQPPCNGAASSQLGKISQRPYLRKFSSKVPTGNFKIAQVTYEINVRRSRSPRRMHCVMHSIPASALDAGGTVPCQPENLVPRSLEDSFQSISFRKSSSAERSIGFSGSRCYSDIAGGVRVGNEEDDKATEMPLVLRNKAPRWVEQLQCWCLDFGGRVTMASVKNFQLIEATQPAASHPSPLEQDKIILQFGKVAEDMFTMDYRYPLSAFQAFAICLCSFSNWPCEYS